MLATCGVDDLPSNTKVRYVACRIMPHDTQVVPPGCAYVLLSLSALMLSLYSHASLLAVSHGLSSSSSPSVSLAVAAALA